MDRVDGKGRPVQTLEDGTLVNYLGEVVGKETKIESTAFDKSEFAKRGEARDRERAVCEMVTAGNYRGAAGVLLRELKRQKREERQK